MRDHFFVASAATTHTSKVIFPYLLWVDNDAVIAKNILLCGFDVLQIDTATTVIDENCTIASW